MKTDMNEYKRLGGFPPKCYLIGAQKAGTTYLASLLDQHPRIIVSEPKETDFFTGDIFPRGYDWYRTCFPERADGILIDASTSYSAAYPVDDPRSHDTKISFNQVAARIAQEVPDARFLYILRNPIKRTYSAYYHFVRTGEETRPFRDVITTPDRRQEYYFLLSDYAVQLEHYLQHFDADKIKVLIFEEFTQSPQEHVQSCFHFLGLDDDVAIDYARGKHASFQYSEPLSLVNRMLAPWGGLRPLLGKVKKILPQTLIEKGMSVTTKPIPEMTADDRQILEEYFQPRIEKLETLINKPLQKLWLKSSSNTTAIR